MCHHILTLIQFLLGVSILSACQGEIPPTVEPTSCVPQTVEVTRIVQSPTMLPEVKVGTATAEPTVTLPAITIQAGDSSFQMEPAYFDGFVVLSQYYTLLDHGFYEEIVSLYSSSLLKRSGGGNFESDLKSVKVRFIHPYNYWRAQQGLPPQSIPENEIRFIVGTTVFHKGAAWNMGGTPTPDDQTRFVSLVLENDEWKLDEFNSSPWFPQP